MGTNALILRPSRFLSQRLTRDPRHNRAPEPGDTQTKVSKSASCGGGACLLLAAFRHQQLWMEAAASSALPASRPPDSTPGNTDKQHHEGSQSSAQLWEQPEGVSPLDARTSGALRSPLSRLITCSFPTRSAGHYNHPRHFFSAMCPDLISSHYLATATASAQPVWLLPLSPSVARASSALAISILSWLAILITRVTWSALLFASWPGPT